MDFIIDLLNNIYAMIVNILKSAGIEADFPEKLIPTEDAE